MTRNIVSALILVITVVAAVIAYFVLFTQTQVWFNFSAILIFSLITFAASLGIFIAAVLVEKRENENQK